MVRLKIPRQELDRSSFFDCEEQAVGKWIADLPMANLGQTTRQLYQVLSELNRVRMLPDQRMNLLEQLRTPIYYVSRCLGKHYLNQPIVLPEQARKVAELVHALRQLLATGFTIVATHTAALDKHAGLTNPDKLIATALHRATTDHTLNIQQHFQLYQSVNKGVWHHLHQFYSLACQHNILQHTIEDSESGTCTLESSYIRALLIGCCKPNQLRQEDFADMSRAMTSWATLCELQTGREECLFIVDPAADEPPIYRALLTNKASPYCLGLNIDKLVQHLRSLMSNAEPESLKIEDNGIPLARDLLGHLIRSWGSMSKRTFMRLETADSLNICIGLSATHHFAAGELSFEALVEERGAKTFTVMQENPFLKTPSHNVRQKDVWDSPYETNLGQISVPLKSIEYQIRHSETNNQPLSKARYHSHCVKIINSSAHGYCVAWPENAEAHIKTGEIVGIKDPLSYNWSIAVIRWVIHEDNKHTQLGLELISPSAAPYGARIIHKTGAPSDYIRVLVLPGMPAVQRPVTLLTPRVSFRSGQKIILSQRAREIQIQLGKRINDSGAYNQFEFHRISGTHTSKNSESNSMDDFDSLWENL